MDNCSCFSGDKTCFLWGDLGIFGDVYVSTKPCVFLRSPVDNCSHFCGDQPNLFLRRLSKVSSCFCGDKVGVFLRRPADTSKHFSADKPGVFLRRLWDISSHSSCVYFSQEAGATSICDTGDQNMYFEPSHDYCLTLTKCFMCKPCQSRGSVLLQDRKRKWKLNKHLFRIFSRPFPSFPFCKQKNIAFIRNEVICLLQLSPHHHHHYHHHHHTHTVCFQSAGRLHKTTFDRFQPAASAGLSFSLKP